MFHPKEPDCFVTEIKFDMIFKVPSPVDYSICSIGQKINPFDCLYCLCLLYLYIGIVYDNRGFNRYHSFSLKIGPFRVPNSLNPLLGFAHCLAANPGMPTQSAYLMS